MGNQASVNSSVVFERSVRSERPLWTRSVLQVTPAATGIAERAILIVGGLVRTTKAVVEENVLEGRDAGPRLTAWMVHHAAQVICACMVGVDGHTLFRRLKVRKFGTPLAGFGERVWFRDPVLERVNKFNPGCTEARLFGFCLKSSRYIVREVQRWRQMESRAQPPTWRQRQPNPHVREELGRRPIPLHNVWRGIRLMLSRQIQFRIQF